MVINFVCRASKANKEGLSPLELSLIFDGDRRYISLNRRIKASSFNSKAQRVRNNDDANEYLDAIRLKVYNLESEMIKKGIQINAETFIDIFKNGFTEDCITILQMFERHNEQYQAKADRQVVSSSTLLKYNVTKINNGVAENKKLFLLAQKMVADGDLKVGQLIDEKNYRWVHISLPDSTHNNQILHL